MTLEKGEIRTTQSLRCSRSAIIFAIHYRSVKSSSSLFNNQFINIKNYIATQEFSLDNRKIVEGEICKSSTTNFASRERVSQILIHLTTR